MRRKRDLWERRERKRLGVRERRGRRKEEASPDFIRERDGNRRGKQPRGATGRRWGIG